jgi:hypothetical protein
LLSGQNIRNHLPTLLLLGTVMVSVLARLMIAFFMGDDVLPLPGIADQITYNTLAQRVLSGHGFSFPEAWWPATRAGEPTAHWSFLYTYYLAGVYYLFGASPSAARVIQAVVVGIAQPLLVYAIGRRVFSPVIGVLAAGLSAGYAYFVYYAAALMTEPFYITALLMAIFLTILLLEPGTGGEATHARRLFLHFALGLSLGAAVLLRQISLIIIPVIFVALYWENRKSDGVRRTFSYFMFTLIIIALLILPFTVYNMQRFGEVVFLNTNAGFAFFWANHPIYGNTFQPILAAETGTYGELIPKELRSLDEAALDRALLIRGLQFVAEDPVRYIRLCFSRIPAYFMFWPSAGSSMMSNMMRVLSFGILWPFMLYGCIVSMQGKWRTQRGSLVTIRMLLAFVIVYTGIHLLSWALIRYRLPVDSVLMVFAAAGLVDLYERAQKRLRTRSKRIELEA